VFAHGLEWLRVQVLRGQRWRALWLRPEALPDLTACLAVIRHDALPGGACA
jgi:hypothetical protein